MRWLEKNDPNGFLEVAGSRPLASSPNDGPFYYANTNSSGMRYGYNQEETIKNIWAQMPDFYLV
jgi:hypothetical protein